MKDKNPDEEVVIEETDEEGNPADLVKKLREKLKKVTAEKQEYLDGWQRARADYLNFKKEQEETKKQLVMFANERLFDELIPVLDSFDMAFGNKEAWEKADKNWRVGVEYIYSQMVKALENHGLTQFSAKIGDKMDNTKYESVGIIPTDDEKNNHTIAEVLKKGYMFGVQVFRPVQVKVADWTRTRFARRADAD